MKIYIDTATGQWGWLSNLRVVEFTDLTQKQQDAVTSDKGHGIGLQYGVPVADTDNTNSNCISYSPSAIRDEAGVLLDLALITAEEYEWVTKWATNDELDEVALYVLEGDDAWYGYRNNVSEGIRWKYEDSSINTPTD